MKGTIIGVDLAKNVIQVCIVTDGRVITNKELLAQLKPWLTMRNY